VGGRSPDELSDAEVAVLGRLLARIHNVAEATPAPHRLRLDSQAFALRSLRSLEQGEFLPRAYATRYRTAVEKVARLYDEWTADTEFHPIHGDCHMGNLLRRGSAWQFLDFDDLVLGPAVQDVWMLLPGRDEHAERQRRALVHAYRSFREFDERSWRLVEPLRAFRFIYYAGWIASRWSDPAFPEIFPHFGTEQYWQKETEDLEKQVDQILSGRALDANAEPPGRAERTDPEAALTNKDFFWDL